MSVVIDYQSVADYLHYHFLDDTKEFMAVRGSEFHNGVEDEVFLNEFIKFLDKKYGTK